ncbi:TPA: nickel pincer cofactor biosynthesis protein LarB [bacterium]|nr:nickel pincer cofactor biosynthesis protein LarB [bacterium]
MDISLLRELLLDVKNENIDIDTALDKLKFLPYEDIGYAKLDHHRSLRKGFPEVVFCQGKTTEQSVEIIKRLAERNTRVLATRADRTVFDSVKELIPDAKYNELARTITISRDKVDMAGHILVISAGTADLPVAEEAIETASIMGNYVERLYDVGVAGIHRLLGSLDIINRARVLIVVAGMEGALPSVVAGLVDKPVIAVPTSTGYGASFKGLSALLTMLNSCVPGIAVVNIDNGFGAGYLASIINRMGE